MDNDGSTSAELEDPRTTTAEPEEVDQERDETAEVTEPETQTETAGAEPEETSAPDAPPEKPAAGKPAKAPGKQPDRPDPVKEAIEKLRSDGPKPSAPAKPSGNAPEKPAPAAKDPAAQPDQRTPPEDTALAWMSPEQRRHTKGSVKEYIRKQHTQLSEATQALEQSKGDAAVGNGWSKLIDQAGLQWEAQHLADAHFAAGLKTQGALARAYQHVQSGYAPRDEDLKILDQHRQSLDAIDRLMGRAPNGEAALHQGDLPADIAGLAELGLSERELRLVAADRARQTGKAKTAAPALAPAPAPRAPTQQPQNAQQRAAPGAQARPDANAALYLRMTANDIVRRYKVSADQADAFYQRNLVPHVTAVLAETYPETKPVDAWTQLSPPAKRDLVSEAMTRFDAAQRSPTPTARRPQDAPLRTRGAPTNSAPADPVLGAIARLRSD